MSLSRNMPMSTVAFAAALLTGCTVTTGGEAVKAHHDLIPVENAGDDTASVLVRDILTDIVAYWEGRGVGLGNVRFSQWDSGKGDRAPECRGSTFPQPAYCSEGWLAWDRAWVTKAQRHGKSTPIMYASRAVADAVADRAGVPYDPLRAVSIQECLTGAYLADSADSTSREIRKYITDTSAYVRGLMSDDPVRDCVWS